MSWSVSSPPPIFEGEDELQLKLQYARLIAGHPEKVETAGYIVFPGDHNYGRAMQARAWRSDPIVIAEMERLGRGEGASEVLPSKAEFMAHLWNKGTSGLDDRVNYKFLELLAKTAAFINDTGPSDGVVKIIVENGLPDDA